jgi:TonB family protein
MKQGGARFHVLAGMLLGLALVAPLAAQNRLYVLEPDGNYHPVLTVSKGRPYIMKQGNLVVAAGQRFALRGVEEYLPVFIAVNQPEAGATAMEPVSAGPMAPILIDREFHFSAEFDSPDLLEDVFFVLEIVFADGSKSVFLYEVGKLEPRTPQPFSVDVPMDKDWVPGTGQYKIHLFVRGAEVFTSAQPADYREKMLDRMILKRLASVKQAGPKPFFGPAPEYPAALRKAGVKGKAVVTVRITPQGTVLDPVVASASDPAFGEAALAAVRQWRFIPRVEDGRAVETRVDMPFVFAPP